MDYFICCIADFSIKLDSRFKEDCKVSCKSLLLLCLVTFFSPTLSAIKLRRNDIRLIFCINLFGGLFIFGWYLSNWLCFKGIIKNNRNNFIKVLTPEEESPIL